MRGTSIRFRLTAIMMALATLPVITMTLIAVHNTRESVEAEIISANESHLARAEQALDELMRQIDTLFISLQINDQLMASMRDADHPMPSVQLETQNRINSTLYAAFHAYSRKIDELTLYERGSGKAFTVNFPGSLVTEPDMSASGWRRILEGPIHMYFEAEPDGIRVFHSINRFDDRSLLGGISARIDATVWRDLASTVRTEPESSFFVLNDRRELLLADAPEQAGFELEPWLAGTEWPPGENVQRANGHLLFVQPVDGGRLTLIKALPTAVIASSANATLRAGIVTGGLFAAASLALAVAVALRITRPIIRLARMMRTANIDKFEAQSVTSRDEIGLLERGYNTMMRRIKDMVETEYRRELQMKNAMLKALQAQIQPHFLNNTLQIIGGMALKRQAPEIYRITKGIGDLLRYANSEADEPVELRNELEHARNYLFIQEQRFAGRVTVDWSVDERVLGSRVPKFVLQPVVENAFEHGLQRKEGEWRLRIRVRGLARRVAVLIEDNGVGMPPETLADLRSGLRSGRLEEERLAGSGGDAAPRRRKGLGLGNVHDRVRLHGGPRCGLRLFSLPGRGTIAVVLLPYDAHQGEPEDEAI